MTKELDVDAIEAMVVENKRAGRPWEVYRHDTLEALIAEVRHLRARINDLMLGAEVDDVYPGQEEAQTINLFEKL